jgi:hypothetical protein
MGSYYVTKGYEPLFFVCMCFGGGGEVHILIKLNRHLVAFLVSNISLITLGPPRSC